MLAFHVGAQKESGHYFVWFIWENLGDGSTNYRLLAFIAGPFLTGTVFAGFNHLVSRLTSIQLQSRYPPLLGILPLRGNRLEDIRQLDWSCP